MFPIKPINKMSLSQRSKVFGVGINDADYLTTPKINKIQYICPFYAIWKNMLRRCYDSNFHVRQPTYKDCIVCNEWLLFSNFKKWMELQDWKGMQLDKDLLSQGNKTYSPDLCLLVSHKINTLLCNAPATRGSTPQGVSIIQNKYIVARCNIGGGNVIYLGTYKTVDAAFNEYKKFKYSIIASVAETQKEPIRSALLKYKIKAYG